ncbi:exopolyphosphatase PRUNE1 isoform X2 [Pempheris klunzingeri]|uniref:exopolyphosphatase PRUNE1 isoform X2 n=1 Tax=Pempheris klunzingeri TaxID=3127111 RepID=UPI003980DD88
MEEFLLSCCRAVKVSTGEAAAGFHVVLGNESCDIDSMVCALTYAYFLSKSHRDMLALPLLNIRRSDLSLRSDNVALLQQVCLPVDLLLFRDQLDLRALQRAGRLRLTLVDHNILPRSDSDLEAAVVEVIDHHLLERPPSPSCPVTVEMVGSCATLVTERIIQKAPEILDQQVAELLYGLNTEQMLLKDMKAVSGSLNLAVSVLYVSLEDFLRGAGLEAELSGFSLKFGFDVLLLMTICFTESNEPIRELAVFSHSTTCRQQVSLYLEQARNPTLDLRPISSPHPHITAYQQGNALASRKKLLPILKDFLKEWDGDGCLGDVEEEEEEESRVPPTPMNSLVDGCPLDDGLPHLSAQDLHDKFSKMADRGGD